jgi:hypothetical protein
MAAGGREQRRGGEEEHAGEGAVAHRSAHQPEVGEQAGPARRVPQPGAGEPVPGRVTRPEQAREVAEHGHGALPIGPALPAAGTRPGRGGGRADQSWMMMPALAGVATSAVPVTPASRAKASTILFSMVLLLRVGRLERSRASRSRRGDLAGAVLRRDFAPPPARVSIVLGATVAPARRDRATRGERGWRALASGRNGRGMAAPPAPAPSAGRS